MNEVKFSVSINVQITYIYLTLWGKVFIKKLL